MKQEVVNKLKLGLYRVYWKSGGSSLAAVGMTYDGGRWLAPINWTHPDTDGERRIWKMVRKVEEINEPFSLML